MGIEDIQISEELETNAPSIKYRGNEGPKSPQEMQQKAEYDMQEYIIEFENAFPEMKELRGTEEYMDMLKDYFRSLSGGQPLPEDPTKPINPFQPKPIGPLPDKRQMAAYGGIMGLDGRKKYGIGSWFQENIMDPIKENPEIALAAAAAGANYYDIIPGQASSKGYLDDFFDYVREDPDGPDGERKSILSNIGSAVTENLVPIVGGLTAGLFTKNQQGGQSGMPSDNTAIQLADLKKSANILDQKQGLKAGLNFLPSVAARKYTPAEMIETYAQAAANGGRIGMAEGGIMDLGGMEKDYRNTGGFVDLGAKEKADDVPARLSVNEFVFTADAVRNAGGGDIDKGAQVMENMMKHLEQGGQVSEESQGMAGARDMFATSERLSEVI
jgi:hypothetical protein